LVADLSDEQLRVARLAIVNPLDWEIGHVAYFQERFALRDLDGRASLLANADALYDSIAIEHDVRWDLDLPSRGRLLSYLERVRDAAAEAASRGLDPDAGYRQLLAVFHEDMHDEAFTYTRQTMAFPAPRLSITRDDTGLGAGPLTGDVSIGGGRFRLGAAPGPDFAFDNEHTGHEVDVAPFAIARAAVTMGEFAAFVEDGGYLRDSLWSAPGLEWRRDAQAEQPLYWRRGPDGFERRVFDVWHPLEMHLPVIHVCWYEAEAYCRWAGRRLPREAEWEVAAAAEPTPTGAITPGVKRRYPWGDAAPTAEHVNMDARAGGCVDVGALPAGDSAFGCRQMLGNTWEWTSDTFGPYPGFEPGPYEEYSAPLFGSTKVLRGGCWATRSRLIRNTWRNYYEPHRRDVWAGFRTCAP
jgi:iron(II)-dependent oxidoreductase